MDHHASQPITQLLRQMRAGDSAAGEQVLNTVYRELRRLAAHYLRNERAGHTLQPTALVHEIYSKLFGESQIDWQSRAHFYAVAASQMRRELVDHARARNAEKRGSGAVRVELRETDAQTESNQVDILAVDKALAELAATEERPARVVELKFFGGLTDREAAEVIGVPLATVRRDWEYARAWLYRRLESPAV